MGVVKYKDYQGSVNYEDGALYVQILHIDDLIIGECTDAGSVQTCFEELVDDYLQTCEELGKEPNKPFKGSFNVRISPEKHRAAALAAGADGESLNSWVAEAIDEKLAGANSNKGLTFEEAMKYLEQVRQQPTPYRVQSIAQVRTVSRGTRRTRTDPPTIVERSIALAELRMDKSWKQH